MASCTQIDGLLQAYMDQALGHSERLIVDHHIEECQNCRRLLKRYQQSSAMLFETLSDHRLRHDLTQKVLEHLPEMELQSPDIVWLNKRAKNPTVGWDRAMRLMPVAAAVLLIVLTGVMFTNWPDAPIGDNVLGVVLASDGLTQRSSANNETSLPRSKSFIEGGESYETASGASLMLGIIGSTYLKLNENTRIELVDERTISIEVGEVFLDVGKARRPFKVLTPSGEITVLGTAFDVRVKPHSTRVVVEKGTVQVEYQDQDSETASHLLKRGQEVNVSRGLAAPAPRAVDTSQITRWAKRIVADEEAKSILVEKVQPRYETAEVSGGIIYRIPTYNKPVKSITIDWDVDTLFGGHCGYDVYVYTDIGLTNLLFQGKLSPALFANKSLNSYDMPNSGDTETPLSNILIKLVPNCDTGSYETKFADEVSVSLFLTE